ncbi:MAG TPA: ChaN family lipoprotein [Vulgatibacter sp.]
MPEAGFVGAGGEAMTAKELAERARGVPYVLVGEAHDSACDHEMQARVLEALAASGLPPVVGLEMVAVDAQHVLDRFGDGSIGLEELPAALDWQGNWGVDFAIYEPIFVAAQRWGLPVVALNLPRRLVREVARAGVEGLPPDERANLPRIVPPPPAQEAMLREAYEAHAGQGHAGAGEEGFRRFVLIQSLWDSQMASAAIAWRRDLDRQPVAILAGAGHVAHGWGIPHRLRVFDPTAETLSIVPWGAEAPGEREDVLFYRCPAP